jgi:hypothetical protein
VAARMCRISSQDKGDRPDGMLNRLQVCTLQPGFKQWCRCTVV